MSALEFLSVSAADAGALARSSLERAQREAGARFEERDGWLLPVAIPGEEEHTAAGIADLSHLTKLEVRPAGAAPALVTGGRKPLWYPSSPKRALALCEPAQAAALREQLADRLVLDMTGALAVIAISGSAALTVIRRLTHLHEFPKGGEVAHITAHVLNPQPDTYWIVFPQEYGHYLWDVVVDRARLLGGGPIGVDAL